MSEHDVTASIDIDNLTRTAAVLEHMEAVMRAAEVTP
jgi:hypothetical protein